MLRDKEGTFGGFGSNNPKNAALFVRRGHIAPLLCPSSELPELTQPWLNTGEAPPNSNAGLVGLCIPCYVGVSGGDMGYYEGKDLRFKTLKPDIVFNTSFGSVATDGVLVPCRTVAVRDILDGTSNTIAVGEQSDWGFVNGRRTDIRSSAFVGGFRGVGDAGLSNFGGPLEAPAPPRWQSMSFYQTTSSALTTVRWPVNFKTFEVPGPSWVWDFPNAKWRDWKYRPPPCAGDVSGLESGSTLPCPTIVDFHVGGNLPIQSAHPGGAHVLFADGHVSFLSDAHAGKGITRLAGRGSVLERLCVRDDGRPVEISD